MAEGRLCVEITAVSVISRQFLEESWHLGRREVGEGEAHFCSVRLCIYCTKQGMFLLVLIPPV